MDRPLGRSGKHTPLPLNAGSRAHRMIRAEALASHSESAITRPPAPDRSRSGTRQNALRRSRRSAYMFWRRSPSMGSRWLTPEPSIGRHLPLQHKPFRRAHNGSWGRRPSQRATVRRIGQGAVLTDPRAVWRT